MKKNRLLFVRILSIFLLFGAGIMALAGIGNLFGSDSTFADAYIFIMVALCGLGLAFICNAIYSDDLRLLAALAVIFSWITGAALITLSLGFSMKDVLTGESADWVFGSLFAAPGFAMVLLAYVYFRHALGRNKLSWTGSDVLDNAAFIDSLKDEQQSAFLNTNRLLGVLVVLIFVLSIGSSVLVANFY